MIQELKKDLYYFSLSMTIAMSIGLFIVGMFIVADFTIDKYALQIFLYSTVLAWIITFIVYMIYEKGSHNIKTGRI